MTETTRQPVRIGLEPVRRAIQRRPKLSIGLGLAWAALAATLTNSPGRYIGDNRFEQYWSPGGRILRETALWDGGRGVGRVAEEFWPSSAPIGFLRSLGFAPDVAERLWHSAVLVLAGMAVVYLVKVFIPRVGAVHAIAAFAYTFNPFVAAFMLPSVLFWNYAIAPVVLLAFLRGIQEPRRWRWPAVLALAVFAAGNADVPGTIYVLLLLLPAALYVTVVARTASWGELRAFIGRALLLTVLCSAAALTKTAFGSASLEARLAATELPRRVNTSSSWSESWRLLGFWLSYFGDADELGRLPGGRYYWESVPGVIVSFLAPLAAVVAVAWTRWRPRWLFVGLALTSIALMVGSYPPDDASPFGRGLLWVFENIAAVSSLRNTYKAGSGLVLAVAVLLAVLAASGAKRLRAQGSAWHQGPYFAAAGVIVASALPFANGGLYPERAQLEEVPSYWEDALAFVEDQPGDGRVLVLPGTTKTAYRWGWPGDDIFDSFLHRHPNVISNAFPLSEPLAASAIDALDEQAAAGTIAPGTIASVARRLGITHVIVRNDLDWARSQVPRPHQYAPIRADNSLTLAADFGGEGENVVAAEDDSVAARFESELAPVEVYEVNAAPGRLVARSAPAPAVVAGDGSALALIGAEGAAEDARPVRFSAELADDELLDAITGGGPVVVTDTNRRRVVRIRGAVPTVSETLAPGQDLDQQPGDLWDREGSQSVAVHPDATEVSATSSGVRLAGYQPWVRPAHAFDGDVATRWVTGGLEDAVGRQIRVDFDQPTELASVRIVPYRPPTDGRIVTDVRLRFSSGEPVEAALSDEAETTVSFPARESEWLEVEIAGVDGPGETAVGFREIEIPGLDLAEFIRVPDDLFVRAEDNVALREALTDAPTTYLFERRIGRGEREEEAALRRQFPTLQAGPVEIEGALSLERTMSDEQVSEVLAAFDESEVVSWGSSRFQQDLDHRGELATDGDSGTAWGVRADENERLTVTFPGQQVDEVTVRSLSADATELESAVVYVDGEPIEVELEPEAGTDCTAEDCDRIGVARLPDTTTIDVLQVGPGRTGDLEDQPVRIAEVEIGGPDGEVTPGDRGAGSCADGILSVDGVPVPIALGDGGRSQLVAGRPVRFAACDVQELAAGEHEVVSPTALIDRLLISFDAAEVAAVQSIEPTVDVLERTPDRLRVEIDAAEPAWVSTGQSYHSGWEASTEAGVDLGAPIPLDGQSAWAVPEGRHVVDMTFGPSRFYRAALAVTGFAVLVCIGLVLVPRREADR